jgi:RNA polymerase sigma-70 factor (ECF subfamily)
VAVVAGTDEDELVRRAQGGDVDAYAALLRAHRNAARRLGAVLAGPGDADEVVQDAFVKAWDGLASFRVPASFRPWLLRIVANEARNRRRAAGRRAHHELRFAADRTEASSAPTPEGAVLAEDTRRTVRAALADLPERERDVLTCRYVVGLTEHETAAVLGIPRGTVKSRAARGLARLRTGLDRGRTEGGRPDGG